MTSAHSTRNTSIRTRKIRGEDSLLSSISISEREEGPEGICGCIRYEKPSWGTNMAQRAGEKSWEAAISGRRWWNLSRNPALTSAYFATFRCPTGIFHVGLNILRRWGHCCVAFDPDDARLGSAATGRHPVGSIRSGPFYPAWSAPEAPYGRSRARRPMRQRRYRDRQLRTSPLFPPPPA